MQYCFFIATDPPPPVLFKSSILKDNTSSEYSLVTIQWNNSFTEAYTVLEYCVVVPQNLCQSENTSVVCVPPDTNYSFNCKFETGIQYELTMYAKNCKFADDSEVFINRFSYSTSLFILTPQGNKMNQYRNVSSDHCF